MKNSINQLTAFILPMYITAHIQKIKSPYNQRYKQSIVA